MAKPRKLGTALPYSVSDALASTNILSLIASAVDHHGVLLLRGESNLSPSALTDFMRQLSRHSGGSGRLLPVISDVRFACAAGADEPNVMLVLSNIPDSAQVPAAYRGCQLGAAPAGARGFVGVPPGRASVWHQDEQFRQRPAQLTVLYCVRTPPVGGLDDTRFADTAAGYASLPEPLRERVDAAWAEHSLASVPMADGSDPTQREDHEVSQHPLVLELPSGRRCLYIGAETSRVPGREGLLSEVLEHCLRQGVYRHRWRPGDVVLMDNRSVIHAASGTDGHAMYEGHERLMLRVQSEEPHPLQRWAAAEARSRL